MQQVENLARQAWELREQGHTAEAIADAMCKPTSAIERWLHHRKDPAALGSTRQNAQCRPGIPCYSMPPQLLDAVQGAMVHLSQHPRFGGHTANRGTPRSRKPTMTSLTASGATEPQST